MIPQLIKYFRFDSYTDSDGTVYMAPPNFKSGDDYYRGYDLEPFTVKYNVHRDVDLQPDTFVITVDNYFFQNPTNSLKYSQTPTVKLTDTLNSFSPTINHVIAIGPLPEEYDTWTNFGTETYCYEDHQKSLNDGPTFGFVKSWNQGAEKTDITCVSFLKVLAESQVNTSYLLNEYQDDLNTLQIYYEYKDSLDTTSAPYFAAKDIKNIDKHGEYRIQPAGKYSYINEYESQPTYPLFSFFTSTIVDKEGYATSKIVWRLLQEVGWCRLPYITSAEDIGATPTDGDTTITFINPYQVFSGSYNPAIMTGSALGFNFTAFDIDGLRYEYAGEAVGTEITYEETYLKSFDASKQSLLFNLKTLCDTDGLYLNVTCCPKFVQRELIQYSEMVWDYNGVYDNIDNLKRWGVSAGFKPKVMIRRNTAQIYDFDTLKIGTENDVFLEAITATFVSFGSFNNEQLKDTNAQVLAKTMKWEQDQTDVINKLLIKYGQGTDYANNYIELPMAIILEDFYIIDLSGAVESSQALIILNISFKDSGNTEQTYTISKTYPVGATSFDISNDIITSFRGSEYFDIISSGDSLLFVPINDATKTLWAANNLIGESSISVAITYNNTPGSSKLNYQPTLLNQAVGLGYTIEFIETEPPGFNIAKESQKLNGIRTAKISLPEVNTVSDVLKIADRVFIKLGKSKYRCQTECVNSNNWQLPLFALYNVIDNTHTKRVLNDEGASIYFIINGSPTSNGKITLAFPHPLSYNLIGMVVDVTTGQTAATMLASIQTQFDALYLNIDYIDTVVDPSTSSIEFSYGTELEGGAFKNKEAFYQANIGINVKGVTFKRIINPPSPFKETAFDEYLPLVSYDANSNQGSYTCVFGIPNEDLANVINQTQTGIGDVQKSQ